MPQANARPRLELVELAQYLIEPHEAGVHEIGFPRMHGGSLQVKPMHDPEVDPQHPADDLPDLTVANALAARKVEAAYAQAVRNELGTVPALVDVRREPTRIVVNVQVPAAYDTASGLSAVADRARKAVRDHDPYVSGIDINVVCYPDPDPE